MRGAISGCLTALGITICILATELPTIPHDMAWRLFGLVLICSGIWPMAYMILKESNR